MGALVFFSLFVKFLGALFEIISQSLVSQLWSVDIYGTYSFYVSMTDIFYSCFFAGVVKFNNYYIPRNIFIEKFKKGYYYLFVIPILIIGVGVSFFIKSKEVFWMCLSGIAYMCAMDVGSSLMSYGKYSSALIGEYVFGRIILIGFILALYMSDKTDSSFLYIIYGLQFVMVYIFYLPFKKKVKKIQKKNNEIDLKEAIKKYLVFQSTESSNTIIVQTSVIVQYIFGGAYQTALVSIVLIIRKLINFISGPTSKLYQPEFSRKYAVGDNEGLSLVYAQITRLQLCFMTPVFTFLIAAPEVLLLIFSKELVGHTALVQGTSVVFLFMIAFGPQSNFLSMTGKEKGDTFINWISIIVLYGTMFLLRTNKYFVVIGFCTQIIFSTLCKLILYVWYMKKLPMPIVSYLKLFFITILGIGIVHFLPNNIFNVVSICVVQFIINFLFVLPREEVDELMSKFLIKRRKN